MYEHNGRKYDRFDIRITSEEKALMKTKAKLYGFNTLADYIVASAIYENLYIEEIEGKDEVTKIVNTFINKIEEHNYLIREYLNKNMILDNEEIRQQLIDQQKEMAMMIDELKNTMIDKLYVNQKRKATAFSKKGE